MLLALLLGICVGFVLAIPPGPVAVAILKSALDEEKVRGFKIGLGAVVMDIIYVGVVVFTLSFISDWIKSMPEENPVMMILIQTLCVVVLVAYGVISLRRKNNTDSKPAAVETNANSTFIDKIKSHGPFFIGAGISMANLANPTFIPSIVGLVTGLITMNWLSETLSAGLTFAFGFGIGTFCWIYVFIRLITHYRNRMSQKFIERIHQFAGVTMIGFGAVLGFKVLASSVRWADVVRLLMAI